MLYSVDIKVKEIWEFSEDIDKFKGDYKIEYGVLGFCVRNRGGRVLERWEGKIGVLEEIKLRIKV